LKIRSERDDEEAEAEAKNEAEEICHAMAWEREWGLIDC